jgi:hypothetical protein
MARSALKIETRTVYGAVLVFVASGFALMYLQAAHNIVLGLGISMILYSLSVGDLAGSILAGAIMSFAVYFFNTPPKREGFQDIPKEEEEAFEEEEDDKEGKEGKEVKPVKAKAKVAKAKKVPPPDHADRPGEMFELGKKYKMPVGEGEDKEFHLDAGTTFMNAYKSLKPEQIAAMTKDTQELMQTQKQLMGTLQTLTPLIQDGKQMMEMFQSYFGSSNPTLN